MSENTSMHKPYISIIIPVKNGISTIESCLKGIEKQSLYKQCEVLIIDSGSTDGTLEVLQNYKVKLFKIPPQEFNHGATRNYGISLAEGELVVMTVQDATPSNTLWLENMARHFIDPEVAGVCGQQVVPHHPDKNPHRWFRPQSEGGYRKVQYPNQEDFLNLTPENKKQACSWDDVTAMYRKTALLEIPFQPVMFGEDMIWARDALLKGFSLIYDSTARVEHYHHHYPDYTYRRVLIVWLFIYKTFGYQRANPIVFKDYILIIYRNIKWKLPFKWIWHNWSLNYYISKAVKDFNLSIEMNQLNKIEQKLALHIPQGKI